MHEWGRGRGRQADSLLSRGLMWAPSQDPEIMTWATQGPPDQNSFFFFPDQNSLHVLHTRASVGERHSALCSSPRLWVSEGAQQVLQSTPDSRGLNMGLPRGEDHTFRFPRQERSKKKKKKKAFNMLCLSLSREILYLCLRKKEVLCKSWLENFHTNKYNSLTTLYFVTCIKSNKLTLI